MERIKRITKRGFKNNQQFIIYTLIGVISGGLDFFIFFTFNQILGLYYLWANIISSTAGISNSFACNTFFNFRISNFFWRRFLWFYTIGITGLLLSSLLLYFFVGLLGLSPLIVKIGTLITIGLAQFTLNKHITFSKQ